MPDEEFVVIGRVLRPQGNKGQIRVLSRTDSMERFFSFLEKPLFVGAPEPPRAEAVVVEDARLHKGFVIVKLEGVNDIDAAEALRDQNLMIRLEDREPPGEGWFYLDQLIGLEIRDDRSGELIGKTTDLLFSGDLPILEISRASDGRLFKAPFARALMKEIDLEAGVIRTDLPEGLDEL